MADRALMVSIEVKKEKGTYSLYMPYGAPLQECYDAAKDILEDIVKMSEEAAERAKKEKEESDKKEDADKEASE